MSREEVFDLIEEHLAILPHIFEKLELYLERFRLADHVLGIHYRGTDRMAEMKKKNSHDEMIALVRSKLFSWEGKTLLYVATDEQKFLDRMKRTFPGQVICLEEAERSQTNQSFHQNLKSPYQAGEDALVDCLLLSKTDYLMRTESCLSRWSGYFNPLLHIYNTSR